MAGTALIFFSAIVTSLSYTYYLSSNLPKGIYRLTSLLPIFFLLTILPLLLSSAVATAVATFFLTWLTNSKLLLFAFDHGPLSSTKSLIQFIAIASLPAKIKPQIFNPKLNKSRVNLGIESLVFPLLINFAYNHKHDLNPHVLLILYCFLIFILIDLLVFVSNGVVRAVAGLELEPPSDEPYLSTSLQDFWGRRWNLMVTNSLRYTVYKPVKSVFPAKEWATVPAVMATFLVSGLMHELLFYYVARVSPTWEMTSFFVLHGICLVVELKVKRLVAGKLELPAVVARLLTVGFMFLTSFLLFFPPLIKSGADVKVLEEFKLFIDYVKTMVDVAAVTAVATVSGGDGGWLHEKSSRQG
ncbi:hypothetical protein L6452_28780 [Arctium lappa]|uniref:Uncharacterized protein n=1 Tax=Arctium lappa TaxID=4217 RepID=A0ACB8ZZ69_ARCLA|nr:hypothetical protein L6452_28780 [Arctium lappa]